MYNIIRKSSEVRNGLHSCELDFMLLLKDICNIMYLLTEWEGWTGKYLAQGAGVRTPHLLYDPRAFGMFTYVAHFDEKVGIFIATKLS